MQGQVGATERVHQTSCQSASCIFTDLFFPNNYFNIYVLKVPENSCGDKPQLALMVPFHLLKMTRLTIFLSFIIKLVYPVVFYHEVYKRGGPSYINWHLDVILLFLWSLIIDFEDLKLTNNLIKLLVK